MLALTASGLGLNFSMRLHDRNDIPSLKSAWSLLHSELKAHVQTSLDLERNNEGRKTNTK